MVFDTETFRESDISMLCGRRYRLWSGKGGRSQLPNVEGMVFT